jgi:uncharacterized protein
MGMFYGPYFGIYVISALFMVIGLIVSGVLKSKMKKYAQIPNTARMTGKEVAEKMLKDHGIYDVKVVAGTGFLTDHYNPATKTVSLSETIYNTPSIAAAAVAAHEVGHAVQHANSYAFLKMRSALVPLTMVSGFLSQIILFIGVLVLSQWHNETVLMIGIGLFSVTTFFTVVTLPVEVDASRRALIWVQGSNIARGEEYKMAADGLRWAAMTYFVAALQSVATLLYYISLLNSRD